MSESKLPKLSRANGITEQLDRLPWVVGISLVVYGVRIGIRTNHSEILTQFLAQFSLPWKPARSPVVSCLYSIISDRPTQNGVGGNYRVYVNASELLEATDLPEVFFEIERDLTIYLSDSVRHRVFINAGAVGWNGKAILIPGHFYIGKTVLLTELVRAGATYYSDQYAVLDAQGRVNPLPLRMNARDENGVHRFRYTAESLGSRNEDTPLPIGLVVFTAYKPGARWRPRRLSTGQAILELLANSSTARWQPVVALSVIERAASKALALKGVRGEACDTVSAVLKHLKKWAF